MPSAITAQAKQVERLEAEKAELRAALTRAADALALMVEPKAIVRSTAINAWAQAYSAESFARSALAKTEA